VAPVPSAAVPMARPSATYQLPPPCTQTLRKGCRNVGKPAGTVKGSGNSYGF
jgi:hypothetical protein